jgi:hypothetical protein
MLEEYAAPLGLEADHLLIPRDRLFEAVDFLLALQNDDGT